MRMPESSAALAPALSGRILVIDDEERIVHFVRRSLEAEGLEVDPARDGEEGLRLVQSHSYDLVILDLVMPGLDGLTVLRQILEIEPGQQVLVLSARDDTPTKVALLDHGADDYLSKPFSLDELLARMRALLRRASGTGEVLRFADLTLDVDTREAYRDDRLIRLTPTEFFLLELMLRYPRRVLTREFIFDRVWGYGTKPTSNSLEVYVGYLRRKLEEAGESRLIHTARGVGYALREP